ncbi:MAG TPA: Xaa-Pro peptidase family protein [Synergistaceae bacterium]|nr:Xaa-Pro peptidase family protein [Synergistaceae bacterium]HPJ25391.1 Xaa-Pro peptidase family protein [Synergistaceae bacterium]HPQ37174.1 Xaa-Pro peptidase family protein [Synergistaceae bacterium]
MLQQEKVTQIAGILREKAVDALLLGPTSDLEYISGLHLQDCERFKGCFILQNGQSFCICPRISTQEFRECMPENVPVLDWQDKDWFYETLSGAFEKYGLKGKSLAVNDGVRAVDAVEIMQREGVTLVNGWHYLDNLRSIKSSEEMAKLKKAGEIADAALEALLPFIRPGKTEREIKRKLLALLEEKGADGTSFYPIVARGENAAMAHYTREDGIVQEQDTVLIDYGCRYKGYCSDTTRTLFVGKPSEEALKFYRIVQRSQEAGEKAVQPGVSAESVDLASRKVIEDEGYGDYFNNRVGHGIGMAVHEAPNIMRGNTELLQEGMAFSVEPGIYIPGKIGIRIENIVVVTKDGCVPMSTLPRDPIQVDA